jgi:hypothetical protein
VNRTIDLTKTARAKAIDFAEATRPAENGARRVTVVV